MLRQGWFGINIFSLSTPPQSMRTAKASGAAVRAQTRSDRPARSNLFGRRRRDRQKHSRQKHLLRKLRREGRICKTKKQEIPKVPKISRHPRNEIDPRGRSLRSHEQHSRLEFPPGRACIRPPCVGRALAINISSEYPNCSRAVRLQES